MIKLLVVNFEGNLTYFLLTFVTHNIIMIVDNDILQLIISNIIGKYYLQIAINSNKIEKMALTF